MTKFTKMKKQDASVCQPKTFSDVCISVLFTVFVFSAFLLMFSYADNLSHARERLFSNKQKVTRRYEDFAVVQYTWKCKNEKCVRSLAQDEQAVSLDTCTMLCSQPSIWPKPRHVSVSEKSVSIINLDKILFNLPDEGPTLLQNATDLFRKNLELLSKESQSVGVILNITIGVDLYNLTKLTLKTNESYELSIRKESGDVFVQILAENYFGIRHGLETLSQLIWYDEVTKNLKILHDVDIKDSPKFPYRGLMVDTARNFFPLHQLKKIVNGMAMTKLNVLHLHLTDAVSFPIILPNARKLAEYGAYGIDMVYTPENINDLKQYAQMRGVRLILEIDVPSHVNAGWNYAKDLLNEDYVICGEKDVFNGHLNPDNPNVLQVLETIYGDLLDMLDGDEIFHIGGDEVNLKCWEKTKAAKNVFDMTAFWANYTNSILDRLRNANGGEYPEHIIMWSSPLTASDHFKDLDANITVQFWLGNPYSILSSGHSIIYSTVGNWYLDCGFGPWKPDMNNGVCDPYTPWQKFYKYQPWRFYGHGELALGGEVCLWAEQVDVDTLETRIWPRTAAFAERVWLDPDNFDDYDVYTRLVSFRERLIKRGIQVAGMWPRWCSQNPGKC